MLQYILDHFVISDDAKVTKKLLSCKFFGNFFATVCIFFIFSWLQGNPDRSEMKKQCGSDINCQNR